MAAIALYLRLSLDDDKLSESDSITSQRELLRSYLAADTALSTCDVLEFVDDGWSGTNFERPQVKQLLELAKRGEIQVILVKDLSRWGRNYPEVSEYLDQIFPFLGIRFISVNDQYDSSDYLGQTAPMSIAFSSIMHDIYSKDMSVKIRQSYKAKANKGEYVCGRPPFGYVRSKTQKNLLVIDEGAADIVRRIFSMAISGMSCAKIAAQLNEERVDTAISWYHRNGRSTMGVQVDDEGRTYWGNSQVMRVIREELYTGTLVCFKYKRTVVGNRRQVKVPEHEWLRIPNTHEAIVSIEQFTEANAKLRYNKRTPHGIAPNRSAFTGKIICGHCGRAMRNQIGKRSHHYCTGAKLKKGKGCFEGKVYIDDLTETVLSAVIAEVCKVLDVREAMRRNIQNKELPSKDIVVDELKKLSAHIALLERRGISLYEDFADGKLDKDAYLSAKASSNTELENAKIRLEELHFQSVAVVADSGNSTADEPLLERVLNATDITDDVLSLIEQIIVFDDEHIEIRFTFGDTNA